MSYLITHAPHLKDKLTVPHLIYGTMLALLPATLAGIYFFGWRALGLIVTCVLTALATEFIISKLMKKEVAISDGSSALTGVLLALCLTPTLPYFAAILGTIFAIAIGKLLFGGLGYNIFNPALIGRAFLAAAFPVHMTNWIAPLAYRGVESITAATPLASMKFQHLSTPYWNLILGNVSGCIGETSALLLLVGGLVLTLWARLWRIPLSYLGTVLVLGGVFWLINPSQFPDPLFHLLGGGLMLGAWFMATDPVTSPVTKKGMWIFGIGAGILVVVIRLFSGLPEGVMYSILIMNAFVPLINRYTRPRILGYKK